MKIKTTLGEKLYTLACIAVGAIILYWCLRQCR